MDQTAPEVYWICWGDQPVHIQCILQLTWGNYNELLYHTFYIYMYIVYFGSFTCKKRQTIHVHVQFLKLWCHVLNLKTLGRSIQLPNGKFNIDTGKIYKHIERSEKFTTMLELSNLRSTFLVVPSAGLELIPLWQLWQHRLR